MTRDVDVPGRQLGGMQVGAADAASQRTHHQLSITGDRVRQLVQFELASTEHDGPHDPSGVFAQASFRSPGSCSRY
jgi:hypothetical protein